MQYLTIVVIVLSIVGLLTGPLVIYALWGRSEPVRRRSPEDAPDGARPFPAADSGQDSSHTTPVDPPTT